MTLSIPEVLRPLAEVEGPRVAAFDADGVFGGASAGATYFLTESAALEISVNTKYVFGTDSMTEIAFQGGISVFN